MSTGIPPRPYLYFSTARDCGVRELQARLWTLWLTVVSILATAWLCTLGWLPAIIALVVEKHVLVAILIMHLDAPRSGRVVEP